MAKVQCKELANEPVVFAYIGELTFDADGIVEINHAELLAKLANVKGFSILSDPCLSTTESK